MTGNGLMVNQLRFCVTLLEGKCFLISSENPTHVKIQAWNSQEEFIINYRFQQESNLNLCDAYAIRSCTLQVYSRKITEVLPTLSQ